MSFNFNPAAGETESSSAVDLRRQLAAAMMQQGMQSTPIQSPWQGVARLSEALMGGLAARRQAQQEQAANGQLMAAMTGQPYTPPAQSSGFLSKLFGDNGVPASGAQAQVDAGSPAPQPTGTSQPADISGDRQKFVDTLMPTAMEVSKQTGVDPRIIVAQAAQESGWGAHAPGNNLFGIKSHGQPGGNTLATTEYVNGAPVQTTASFRGYESPADSVRGYGDFIMKNPRYGDLRQAQGIDAQLTALGASGYATDPRYAQHVGAIARGIQIPNEVASLDPSVGMGAAAPIQQPNTQPTMPPPSPTAQPTDMATVSPDQMQAMLGPQPTPGYRDPMVTTAFRQDPAPAPSAQAIQQQAPSPDPQQSASIGPTPAIASPAAQPQPAQANPRAQLAQAMQSAPPQAPNVLANNPRAQALMQAMMNPNASPQVRQMAGVMFQNEMSKGQALYQAQMEQYIKQQDPQYQATLAKAQYEAAHLGQVTPDTAATLQAQRDKPIDVNGHLVTQDGKEVADFSTPNVSTVGNALIDQKTGNVIYQGTPNAEKIQPGESLVNPQTGSVVFQGTGYKPSDVHDMRKEFESLPNYKAYQSAAPVYKAMVDTAGTDSKASDLNLVYGLGKIMDPNSVVREGEMVMVNNTSSLPDWVSGAINSVNGGSRLEPATRKAILNEAKNRILSYRSVLDNDVNQYRGIAQRRGMNPDDILPTLSDIAEVPKLDGSTPTAPVQIKGVDDYQALPSGTQYLDPNGVLRTKQ